MDFRLINIGIADMGLSESPDVLRTILGSCVGICLYDAERKIGGMSHVMLPSAKGRQSSPGKYADKAIAILIEKLLEAGAKRERLAAKIIGGATMFNLRDNSIMGEIGKNNIIKVKEVLNDLGITIIAEDTGGDYGRTIDFYLETGEVRVKSIGKIIKMI